MLEAIQAFLNTFWQIILYIWEGIFIFFHFEEWLIKEFKEYGVPVWIQLVTIIPFNTVLIAVEIFLFRQLKKTTRFFRSFGFFVKKKFSMTWRQSISATFKSLKNKFFKKRNNHRQKKSGPPKFLLAVLNGRPIGRRVFFFLGLIPECQKVGTFVYGLNIEKYGWQGYLALCLGGALRVTIVVLSPMWVLWLVVVGALSLRLLVWLLKKLYQNPDKDKTKEETI